MTMPEGARLQSRTRENVMLEGVRIDGAVSGLMLQVSVEQRFHNPGPDNIEIVYTFPLPSGAVLLGVEVRLGERQLSGAVVEKREAAQAYEDSMAAGDAAIMLEKNRDHSYSLNLGNLAAGEACVVTLRYAETLQFEQRGLRICIPTVIAPRYGKPTLAPHQAAPHDLSAHYPFRLTLQLPHELARARVGSPSHAVSTQLAENGVTVALAQPGALDRDFVLVLDQLTHDSLAIATSDTVKPGASAALASFCPRFAAAPRPIAAKLLVDCSGSMAGDSMAAARRALQAIIGQFGQHDRFSLSCFGSMVRHRARGLWTTSERTRLAASRWVGALDASMGGTEMEEALESTFAIGPGGQADVLMVTDGQIEAIDSVIAAAKASGHRMFVVAIGSSPAESHLRRLAQATGGACDFVASGERVEPAVLRMFARLRSPRLNRLRVSWPGGVAPGWTSPLPESVFDGDTVNLFAQFPGEARGEVRLFGCDGDQPEQEIARASISPASGEQQALARLAAHAQAESHDDAVRLALDYQLVTQRTSFLLIHQRAERDKPADMPALHQVATMVPAGWSGAGSVTAQVHGPLSMPAVWRRSAPSDAMMVNQQEAVYDIPAFLRRADAPSEPEHWSFADSCYRGMTPLGLTELLRLRPPAQWSNTYAELRGCGLGVAVVDWLELSVGKAAGEQRVVASFLFVMSLDATRAALKSGLAKAAFTLAGGLLPRAEPAVHPDADLALAERIAAQLAAMNADSWPPCVFDLDEFTDHFPEPA